MTHDGLLAEIEKIEKRMRTLDESWKAAGVVVALEAVEYDRLNRQRAELMAEADSLQKDDGYD